MSFIARGESRRSFILLISPSFEAHPVERKGVALRRGAGGCSKGGKNKPTVGRPCDLPWVVSTTYSRFFRRPTMGRFLGVSKDDSQALEKDAFRWVERSEKKCRLFFPPFEGTFSLPRASWRDGFFSVVFLRLLCSFRWASPPMVFYDLL